MFICVYMYIISVQFLIVSLWLILIDPFERFHESVFYIATLAKL